MDEDIDISAIYVLGERKMDFDDGKAREITLHAMKQATMEALLQHKQAGNPIVVYQDGEMVILQPEEIEGANWLVHALQLQLPDRLRIDQILYRRQRVLGDQDLAVRGFAA